ncbi:MAG: uncharacterized protein KVP18_004885 [Porospora cf. gigantea A]|uniref:uncharacterized protein n=1 Tax=Porospora cf. gigantea A TaxID=2853593 RepID=UPI00355A802A|nr:MAG: hypothetical protein KVP18_004885 [Porospora cf. gigantea A]
MLWGNGVLVKIVNDKFGIVESLMTTIHAMTINQLAVDPLKGRKGLEAVVPLQTLFPSSLALLRLLTHVDCFNEPSAVSTYKVLYFRIIHIVDA